MRRRTRLATARLTGVALATLLVTALCPAGTATAQDAAFTIGAKDNSAAEFALGPNGWESYPQTFPEDADVTIGADDPARRCPTSCRARSTAGPAASRTR